jgi:hypothetical protein
MAASDGGPLYDIRSPLDGDFIWGMSIGRVADCAEEEARRDIGAEGIVIEGFRFLDTSRLSRKSYMASSSVSLASGSSLLGRRWREIC